MDFREICRVLFLFGAVYSRFREDIVKLMKGMKAKECKGEEICKMKSSQKLSLFDHELHCLHWSIKDKEP